MKRSQLKQLIKEEIRSVLNEATYKKFSGDKIVKYVERNKPDAEDMEVIKRYFPNAVSSMKEATLNLMTPEKTTSPMFSHIQYNQFEGNYPQDPHPDKEGEGKEFGVHQIQYYNNKPPRFNPKVTELSFTSQQPHYKMGVILVMTDEYLKDLKQLKITKSVS